MIVTFKKNNLEITYKDAKWSVAEDADKSLFPEKLELSFAYTKDDKEFAFEFVETPFTENYLWIFILKVFNEELKGYKMAEKYHLEALTALKETLAQQEEKLSHN